MDAPASETSKDPSTDPLAAPVGGGGGVDSGGGGDGTVVPGGGRRRGHGKKPSLLSMVWSKVEALFWVLVGAGVLYYGDGAHDTLWVLENDERILGSFLHVAAACFVVNASIFIYTQFWLGWWKGVAAVEKAAPWALPVGTLSGCVGLVAWMVAIWPVWHFLSIPITVALFLAFMMALMLLPELGPYLGPAAPKTAQDYLDAAKAAEGKQD